MQKLMDIIYEILSAEPAGLTEFRLLQLLRSGESLPNPSEDNGELSLFREHFLIMHSLYSLQKQLSDNGSGWYLQVSPLNIRLEKDKPTHDSTVAQRDDSALRDYYLDLNQLEQMTGEELNELLGKFWQSYAGHISQDDALSVLGANKDMSFETIKRQYRVLASQYHPDKGGDAKKFAEIRLAYEHLAKVRER